MPLPRTSTLSLSSPSARGDEPDRALALGDVPALAQVFHRVCHQVRCRRATARGTSVEVHAQRVHVGAGARDHLVQRQLAHRGRRLLDGQLQKATAVLRRQLGGEVDHVLAEVAVGGHLHRLAEVLGVAGPDAGKEGEHARAGVVDVVFALDLVAGLGEHVGQRVAQRAAAAAADVQRAGGVGADELHLHPGPVPRSTSPKASPASRMSSTCWASQSSASVKLMKPGPASVTLPRKAGLRQVLHQHLGDGGRAHARGAGQLQG